MLSWIPSIALSLVFLLCACLHSAAQQEYGPDLTVKFGNHLNIAAQFSPDGKYITATTQGYVLLFDAENGDSLRRFFEVPFTPVYAASWSPDGGKIVTSSVEKASVWNTATWQEARELGESGTYHLYTATWSSDGSMIAIGEFDSVVRVWNAAGGELVHQLSFGAHARDIAFFDDDTRLFVSYVDGGVRIWNLDQEQIELEFWVVSQARHGVGNAIGAINPAGTLIATWGADEPWTIDIKLWNARTGDSVGSLAGHTQGVTSLEFSPDGEYLVSAGGDSAARLWRISDHSLVGTFRGHNGRITDVDMSVDGRRLVTNGIDSTIRIWSLDLSSAPSPPVAGESLAQLRSLHPNPAGEQVSVSFSLLRPASVQLRLVNNLGQQVAELSKAPCEAGEHEVSIDLRAVPSGRYFCLLETGREVVVGEVNVTK